MSPATKVFFALIIGFFLPSALRAYEAPKALAPRAFRYSSDTFGFANETVWNYVDGTVKSESPKSQGHKREYTRRCFVMARAAVQFWKFARFEPNAKPLPPEELAARIRKVTERSVWLRPLPYGKKTVFSGYSNLREISAAWPGVFQANIGQGWPIYFRAGNMPIVAPIPDCIEADLNDEIFHDLQMNYPTIVWLYNFPNLNINHTVVVFAGQQNFGRFRYRVYDPNYLDGPEELEYDPGTERFSYQPTFYFKGGAVSARAVYRGLLQ